MAKVDIFNTRNKYKVILADPPWDCWGNEVWA